MTEIKNIARKKGIKLQDDIIEKTIEKARTFPKSTKTSYQRDVEITGKKNEGDLFGGTIIRLGKQLSVQTSITEKLYKRINKKRHI